MLELEVMGSVVIECVCGKSLIVIDGLQNRNPLFDRSYDPKALLRPWRLLPILISQTASHAQNQLPVFRL